MQKMSEGAQNGISSALHTWQELGHMLMLVSRKYQEAWSFLLHFFLSVIGYRIMTWGSSMRETLQTTYGVELMLIVPGCCMCCPVAPVCATQRCIMWRVLVTAGSFEHAQSSSCGIAVLTA